MTAVAALRTVEEIALDHGCAVEREVPMAGLTSVGIGGPAEWLVLPAEGARVPALLRDLHAEGERVRFLGNGTNLLVGDAGVRGVVLSVARLRGEPRFEGTRGRVQAGASLPHLVRSAVALGLRGIEFAEGIPGSVGGAAVMNAGAYGGDMGKILRRVWIASPDGRLRERVVRPEEFGYRRSPLGEELVLEAEIELSEDDPERLREEVRALRARRLASQPVGRRSMGCVFQNPAGASAGRLIDEAGLKGARRGGAVVSGRHGNYLLNTGGATAEDFLALLEEVREAVFRRTGILLREEIRVWRDE